MSDLTERRRFANGAAESSLSVAIDASVTSFTLSTATGFPAVPFTAAIDYLSATEEVVLVLGLSGETVTNCVRGFDATAPQSHALGAKFVHTLIALDLEQANEHSSDTDAHGTTSPIVGEDDLQTLTNKTLQGALHEATATEQAVRAKAATTGAAALIEGFDSSGAGLLFKVGRAGDVFIVPNDPDKKPLVVKGAAAQTANLVEVHNSDGVLLLVVTKAGRLVHKPADVAAAAWKYVPPNDDQATYLSMRNAADALDQLLISTWGEITAARLWLTGLFSQDPIRVPEDGSLFKLTAGGDLTLAGDLTVGGVVVSDNPTGRVGFASDDTARAATAGEAKDTGVGNVTFTVVAGHKYRVHYVARAQAVSAAASEDFRIRDGGGGSPGTGSTLLAGASSGIMQPGGGDSRQLICTEIISGLSAGPHTIAAFYASTSGGTVTAAEATGQSRQLTVYDEGTL
jgi:hypothetical protein